MENSERGMLDAAVSAAPWMLEDKLTAAKVAAVSPPARSLHPCRIHAGGRGRRIRGRRSPQPRRIRAAIAGSARMGRKVAAGSAAASPPADSHPSTSNMPPSRPSTHLGATGSAAPPRHSSSSLNRHRRSSSSPSHHRNRLAATPHPLIAVAIPPLCTRNHKSSLIRKMWRGKNGWTIEFAWGWRGGGSLS
uniref:Uncharacterized protein n=1 Tax=Oryza rufipogon TaxID=4529 RepID=A0A0E0QZH9_ORYRU